MVDMRVKIGSVTLANPIMPASGAFSTDLAQVMDLNRLGALVAKTVSREFRAGNPTPQAATASQITSESAAEVRAARGNGTPGGSFSTAGRAPIS